MKGLALLQILKFYDDSEPQSTEETASSRPVSAYLLKTALSGFAISNVNSTVEEICVIREIDISGDIL